MLIHVPLLTCSRANSFWSRPSSTQQQSHQRSLDSDVVVGASYSHADILKLVSVVSLFRPPISWSLTSRLSVRSSPHGRPRSPPMSSKPPGSSGQKQKPMPPIRQAAGDSRPRHLDPYAELYSHSGRPWVDGRDNDTPDDDDDFIYDDAEDEFGLPSLTTTHNPRGLLQSKTKTTSGDGRRDHSNGASPSIPATGAIRLRANSSDIAEERGSLVYPTSRSSERKILRPQYKEILAGNTGKPHNVNSLSC